jgi:cell wall-associated NlpC family hydrolase
MDAQRAAIVASARTWLNTPFHHAACIKGVGVDCLHLLVGVYREAGLLGDFAIEHYPRDWHFHRDEERYLDGVAHYAYQVDDPLPGDLALFKFGRCVSHAAIIIDWPACIHAHVGQGVVEVDGAASAELGGRLHSFWSVIPS